MTIRTVAETGSTNADLQEAACAGAPEGLWLRAERQTAGQGRLGRAWRSPPGNLHASTIVRPRPGDPSVPTLALVAGVALHEVAGAWVRDAALRLKWPNDLMAADAKIAGILLQGAGGAVIAGFGVNLASCPDDLGRATASIAGLTGAAPDPDAFLAALASAFAAWLARWRGEGLEPIRRAWLTRAHPQGTALRVDGREGLFDGLDANGTLRLRLADGNLAIVSAGDVSLI